MRPHHAHRWLWRIKTSQGRRQFEIASSLQYTSAARHRCTRKQPYTAAAPPASVTESVYTMSATKKIYVIFYTTYGHIWKLVEEVVKGINSVDGTEAVVFQVNPAEDPIVLAFLLFIRLDLQCLIRHCLSGTCDARQFSLPVDNEDCSVHAYVMPDQHRSNGSRACRFPRPCLRQCWRRCTLLPSLMYQSSTFMSWHRQMAMCLLSLPGASQVISCNFKSGRPAYLWLILAFSRHQPQLSHVHRMIR